MPGKSTPYNLLMGFFSPINTCWMFIKHHEVLLRTKATNIFMRSYIRMCNLDLILLAQRWKTDTLNKTHCVLSCCYKRYLKDEILAGRWTSWHHYTCITEIVLFQRIQTRCLTFFRRYFHL